MRKNQSDIILSITTAAFALPGVTARAVEIKEELTVFVNHNSYQEKSLDSATLSNPQDSAKRLDVDVNQVVIDGPISEAMDFSFSYEKEVMSGASPWFTSRTVNNDIVQVMSGASIGDTRQAWNLTLGKVDDQSRYVFGVSISDELDYESEGVSGHYYRDSNNRNATWSIGIDYAQDVVEPIDLAPNALRPTSEKKKQWSINGTYTWVVDNASTAQLSYGIDEKSGYLSDPYKAVFFNNGLLPDSRPDHRQQRVITARYKRWMENWNGMVQGGYRFYNDDWKVVSHTVELAWLQVINETWEISPSLRWYQQTDTYFYQAYYYGLRSDGLQSTDYRLSAFSALTTGIELTADRDNWRLVFGFSHYGSQGKSDLNGGGQKNPALLDFDLFNVGILYRFR